MDERPERSKWDDFSTLDKTPEGRRHGKLPRSMWIWITLGCMMVGGLAGGGGYVLFEFWRGMPPRHNERFTLQARMHRRLQDNPVTNEQLVANTRNFAIGGVTLGLVAAAGLWGASRFRGEADPLA